MTKQLVWFGAAVMTTLLALVVLWQFQIVVVYVLISLTLAAALRPLVNRLVGRGFVVRVAWILLYLVVLGGFGFLLFLTGETAINEIQQLAQTVSVQDAWRLPVWLEGSSFQQALVARLPPPSKLFEAVTGRPGAACAAGHPRLHAGYWRRRERRARHSVLEHLLEHQPNSF